MKIALYTIFRCTNYGAVLQAFALSRILRAMFGEENVDVINHLMDPRDNHLLGKIKNPATPWFQRLLNRRKFARRYLGVDLFEARRGKTIRLIEREVRPTQQLYRTPEELATLPRYATVIIGSDQIWHPTLNNDFGDNRYLGSHLPDLQDRVAYAASFGVSVLPDEIKAEYRAAIGRFRVVTCREESGAKICESLLGARPKVVLDPTLLLSSEAWRAVIVDRIESLPKGEIAAYWVNSPTLHDLDSISRIAKLSAKRVRLMCAGPMPRLPIPPEIDLILDADPFDFVAEIAVSSRVITDSFHGVQFATTFQRPFIAVADLHGIGSKASRLVDFAARYGLGSGIIDRAVFHKGEALDFASLANFSKDALARDRLDSLATLEQMVAK